MEAFWGTSEKPAMIPQLDPTTCKCNVFARLKFPKLYEDFNPEIWFNNFKHHIYFL